MANVRQVAEKAKVSIATVSRVLNGHETVAPRLRQRVLDAINDCNYSPKVGRRSAEAIGLVYAGMMTTASPYDSACIEGMVDALEQYPYDLTILNPRKDKAEDETYHRYFMRKLVRGIVLRCTADNRDLVEQMTADGMPLVLLGDHYASETVPCAYSESGPASREAVDYLCSLGHIRIGFATAEFDDGDHNDRMEAYRSVMDSHGLLDETLIWRIPPHRLDGAQLMRSVMGMKNRPTALFIADPLVAVGVVNEAHRMQVKIPEDISIISVDDTDTRNVVYPKMTAVCQDTRRLGSVAVDRVIALATGVESDPSIVAPPAWFEINDTTAPPPGVACRVLPNGRRLS